MQRLQYAARLSCASCLDFLASFASVLPADVWIAKPEGVHWVLIVGWIWRNLEEERPDLGLHEVYRELQVQMVLEEESVPF